MILTPFFQQQTITFLFGQKSCTSCSMVKNKGYSEVSSKGYSEFE